MKTRLARMSSLQPTPVAELSRRFRTRLRDSLDRLGYSPIQRDRSRALATLLGIHESEASTLLNGDSLPDYDLLLTLCSHLQKTIGWFLDANEASFPAGTRLVHSIGPGEDIALALPEDIAAGTAGVDEPLHYFRSRGEMGFGIRGGDYLVVVEIPVQPMSVRKGQIYLLGCQEGFELWSCVSQSPLRASFQSFDGKTTNNLRPTLAAADARDSGFETAALCPGMHHFSEVVTVLKAPKNICQDAAAYFFIS